MMIAELESIVMEIEADPALYEEENFEMRVGVMDRLEWELMDRIEEMLFAGGDPSGLSLLRARVEAMRVRLEGIDDRLITRLRTEIREGRPFREIFSKYFDPGVFAEEIGYSSLDIFFNRLFSSAAIPNPTKKLEPEMVYFQKTPARVVPGIMEKVEFTEQDVFFDLGSGLGQVVMLVNLLAGVSCVGVEIEPAFVDYARERVGELGLSRVEFIEVDARQADYSTGTVFFMYTPFVGTLMAEVLGLLRQQALLRRIRVITYGPCTEQVAGEDWLAAAGLVGEIDPYRLTVFSSICNDF